MRKRKFEDEAEHPDKSDSTLVEVLRSMTPEQRLAGLWRICQEMAKGRIPKRDLTESQKRRLRRKRAKEKT